MTAQKYTFFDIEHPSDIFFQIYFHLTLVIVFILLIINIIMFWFVMPFVVSIMLVEKAIRHLPTSFLEKMYPIAAKIQFLIHHSAFIIHN